MIGYPKYRINDRVKFKPRNEIKIGSVFIVDAYGTFEQQDEPSYDIIVEEENMLYKHIKESLIIGLINPNNASQ